MLWKWVGRQTETTPKLDDFWSSWQDPRKKQVCKNKWTDDWLPFLKKNIWIFSGNKFIFGGKKISRQKTITLSLASETKEKKFGTSQALEKKLPYCFHDISYSLIEKLIGLVNSNLTHLFNRFCSSSNLLTSFGTAKIYRLQNWAMDVVRNCEPIILPVVLSVDRKNRASCVQSFFPHFGVFTIFLWISFGFQKKRSTIDAVPKFFEKIIENCGSNKIANVYLDLPEGNFHTVVNGFRIQKREFSATKGQCLPWKKIDGQNMMLTEEQFLIRMAKIVIRILVGSFPNTVFLSVHQDRAKRAPF